MKSWNFLPHEVLMGLLDPSYIDERKVLSKSDDAPVELQGRELLRKLTRSSLSRHPDPLRVCITGMLSMMDLSPEDWGGMNFSPNRLLAQAKEAAVKVTTKVAEIEVLQEVLDSRCAHNFSIEEPYQYWFPQALAAFVVSCSWIAEDFRHGLIELSLLRGRFYGNETEQTCQAMALVHFLDCDREFIVKGLHTWSNEVEQRRILEVRQKMQQLGAVI